ncbi:hypothetical protein KCV00_g381, partial [Aureobasidium melanogenum]
MSVFSLQTQWINLALLVENEARKTVVEAVFQTLGVILTIAEYRLDIGVGYAEQVLIKHLHLSQPRNVGDVTAQGLDPPEAECPQTSEVPLLVGILA